MKRFYGNRCGRGSSDSEKASDGSCNNRCATSLLDGPHQHLRDGTLPRALRTCLILEIFVQADLDAHHLSRVAGDAECAGGPVVGRGKTLLNFLDAELLAAVEASILVRDLDHIEGLFHLIEIIGGGEAAASAVGVPLVLDKAAA